METALYFPYIRVPSTPWFTQVLLYWDKAAAIVPNWVVNDEQIVGSYMNDLREVGLMEYTHPEVVWDALDDSFIEFLDNSLKGTPYDDNNTWIPNSRELRGVESEAYQMHRRTLTKLAKSKMSKPLFEKLRSRGLAESMPEGWGANWWRVETKTAYAYMACLAAAISGAQPGMFPVTDEEWIIGSLAAGDSTDLEQRLTSLRYAAVTQALPAPAGHVSAIEIRKGHGRPWASNPARRRAISSPAPCAKTGRSAMSAATLGQASTRSGARS